MIACEECGEEIGTKEEIMEEMVEAHKVERNKTVEILCEGCYHEQPLGSLQEDYDAEGEGKTRTFVVSSVDYETDGTNNPQEELDLPQDFTLTLDIDEIGDTTDMQEIADYLVEDISDETGWLVQGFYFQEKMPDGTLVSLDAEGLEFTDWANQETKHHGKTSLKDWADHEIKTHGGKMSFQDWAKHEDKSHIRRYGAEEGCPKCGDVEDYFINECCDTPNCFYCGNECYIRVNKVGSPIKEDHVVNCTEHQCCIEFMGGSRLYEAEEYDHVATMRKLVAWLKENDLEPSDIKGFTPDGHVILKPITQRANYKPDVMFRAELKKDSCCCGATKSNPCACMIRGITECDATCPCSLEKKGVEASWYDDEHIHALQYALREYASNLMDCLDGKYGRDDAEVVLDDLERKTQYFNLLNAENWGGDPTGKLALMLQKVRDKAKEPKKPLKIEKLDAEKDPLWLEKVKHQHYKDMIADLESRNDLTEMDRVRLHHYKDMVKINADEYGAETSGQWEIGEQLEEAQMNAEDYDEDWSDPYEHYDDGPPACGPCWDFGDYDFGMHPAAEHTCIGCEEGVCDGCYHVSSQMCLECANEKGLIKEATKGIDTFTKPFEESSLDSGTVKSIVVGIGIGLLACFGYNKWK